jgi:hypothetical protein
VATGAPKAIPRLLYFVATFAGAFLIAFAVSSSGEAHDFRAAGAGEASYRLSAFRLQFPYIDPTTGKADESRVGLSFVQDWTTPQYPGTADCRIDVFDAEGGLLGTVFVTVDTLVPHAGAGPANLPTAIEGGAPTDAVATCAKADPPAADGGYRFSNLRIEQEHGWQFLVGTVSWTTTEPPGTAMCHAELVAEAGTSVVHDFSLAVPEGDDQVLSILNAYGDGAAIRAISCEPFRGTESA